MRLIEFKVETLELSSTPSPFLYTTTFTVTRSLRLTEGCRPSADNFRSSRARPGYRVLKTSDGKDDTISKGDRWLHDLQHVILWYTGAPFASSRTNAHLPLAVSDRKGQGGIVRSTCDKNLKIGMWRVHPPLALSMMPISGWITKLNVRHEPMRKRWRC